HDEVSVRRSQCIKLLVSVRVRNPEIVAGEHADPCTAREGVLKFVLHKLNAGELNECGEQVCPLSKSKCTMQLMNEVRFLAVREVENVAEWFVVVLSCVVPLFLRNHSAYAA